MADPAWLGLQWLHRLAVSNVLLQCGCKGIYVWDVALFSSELLPTVSETVNGQLQAPLVLALCASAMM